MKTMEFNKPGVRLSLNRWENEKTLKEMEKPLMVPEIPYKKAKKIKEEQKPEKKIGEPKSITKIFGDILSGSKAKE